MSVMLNALEHGRKKRMSADPIVIRVPEWGSDDEPAEIYIWPVTIIEASAINEAMKEGDILSVFETLIQRAKNKAGKRLFTDGSRQELLEQLDIGVVSSVVIQMQGVSDESETDPDAAEGN